MCHSSEFFTFTNSINPLKNSMRPVLSCNSHFKDEQIETVRRVEAIRHFHLIKFLLAVK